MRITYLLVTLLAVSALAHGADLNVPSQYPTIQAAIDAAMKGDTVLVDDGTYFENIDFNGKAITVTSVNGADVTVIDGGRSSDPNEGSVVTFKRKEGPDSILEKFTITNGYGHYDTWPNNMYGYAGGGIYCYGASPTIRNNLITKNETKPGFMGWGSGLWSENNSSPIILDNTLSYNVLHGQGQDGGTGTIACWEGSPIVSNNIIIQNNANWGGGIAFWDASGEISNNLIAENTIDTSGGGLLIYDSTTVISDNTIINNQAGWSGGSQVDFGSPVFVNNYVAGNTAANYCGGIRFIEDSSTVANNIVVNNIGSKGGGLNLYLSSATVTNNVIHGNSATTGGGIYCWNGTTATIMNNDVHGNSAKFSGGGVWINSSSKPVIINTIIWGNSLTTGTVGPEIWVGGMSTLDIRYSDVEGGQNDVFVASNSNLIWGPGMIDADPLFVDGPGGDLHIPYHSPCCGTGDSSCSSLPVEDFEGDPRICYNTVDMGADEHFRHLYYTGNATPGGNVDIILTGLPGTNPVGLIAGFDIYDPPLASMWGDWYVKFPWVGPILLGAMPSPDGVLPIDVLIPGTPPGPYTVYMQVIIGAELTNLCTMNVK